MEIIKRGKRRKEENEKRNYVRKNRKQDEKGIKSYSIVFMSSSLCVIQAAITADFPLIVSA